MTVSIHLPIRQFSNVPKPGGLGHRLLLAIRQPNVPAPVLVIDSNGWLSSLQASINVTRKIIERAFAIKRIVVFLMTPGIYR
jgi:hypothetical protein